MATEADPIVGQWYQRLDKGQKFEVVAIDEDLRIVEVQHFDGDVEEVDLDSWHDMDLDPIESPEDWTGPLDDIERDDLDYTETDMEREDWVKPYREVKSQPYTKDDWGEGRMEEDLGLEED